jgi:dihydrofolate synthase/folylpolyglutamate synthase
VVARVRPHVEAQRASHPDAPPTFFDATTAVALLLFADARVSRVLLEVGLGGRLDSTNAVSPAVTCITSIELEHTDKLGDTLAAIAAEKAGILKPGVPCVMGRLPDEAAEVVEQRAQVLGAPLRRLGVDFDVNRASTSGAAEGLTYREADGWSLAAPLPLLGAHQRENAALALAAVRALDAHPEASLARAARAGFAEARLPGRLEVLGEAPWIVVDAAHTLASARALADVIEERGAHPLELLLSVSADKELDGMLRILLPLASRVWLTRADPIRSLDPALLALRVEKLFPELPTEVVEDPASAVARARSSLRPDGALCCAGSVYLAGAARRALRDTTAD